jgi:hypothetical protein
MKNYEYFGHWMELFVVDLVKIINKILFAAIKMSHGYYTFQS